MNDKSNSNIQFENGHINFNNSKILFNNLTLKLSQGTIKISGDVNDILTNPDFNIKANLNNLDLSKISSTYSKIKSNQAFIKNGEIAIKNNTIKLNNISTIYNSLPLFLNAQIKDFTNNKEINIDFSTIINEQTTDNVINPYLTYPIKIKGELPIKGIIKGNNKNYTIDFNAKIPPNSDISFSGANLGDININRVLDGKIEVNNNIAKFNNLKYTKFITNQNGKTSPITALKINGQIVQSKEDYSYNNLKITTNTPISVRMLNLLFKKSLLKKGNFECDINLNGNTKTPNIQGRVFLEDLDIPLYDTKINNINFNITDKIINGEIIANSKNSDLNIKLKAQNKANAPYIIENINIESSELDIYSLISSLSSQKPINNDINPKQDFQFSTEDIVIKNGFFDIKNVKYEKINSTNLIGKFNLEDNIFNLKESNFDIAQGKITAKGKYNIKNTKLDLRAEMNNCDSNELTKEFLNLSGQIYGKMNGSVLLSGKNLNTPDNIKNLLSNIDFSIDNGKMPKLGSLEYILRAGNVVKNGVLGLSLNNLIQILTPYKTGEFEKINGKLSISNGRIKDLEIMSKGKNMSLYLEGEYDILKNYANITLYGKLSQTISNSLGAIGNISLKQFFESISSNKLKTSHSEELNKKLNKIPSIETQEATPKFFSAKVLGDINKDNYVKSFMWEN